MNKEQRELTRRLFTCATEVIEDAVLSAAKGQSPTLTKPEAATCAYRILVAARDLDILARAVSIVVRAGSHGGSRKRRLQPR